MNNVFAKNRRRFLSVLTALGVSGALQASPFRKVWVTSATAPSVGHKLTRVYKCTESAVVVGREYLRVTPHEAQPGTLIELICSRGSSHHDEILSLDDRATRNRVRDWIREDFEKGQTVLVKGWILSSTEARLCALTALS